MKHRMEFDTRRLWHFTAVTLAVVLGLTLFHRFRVAGQHDFMPFYLGGKLAGSGQIAHIYDESAYQPLIEELRAGGERMSPYGAHYFIRPAFEAFFFVPLALLPYRAASFVALLGNFALLALLVWKLPVWFSVNSQARTWVRCALSVFYPFLWSIAVGQDTLLLTLLVASALVLEKKGRQPLAGTILGLCAWKPHLLWLTPLALLLARRWKMAAYTAGTASALMVLSFSLVGLDATRRWLALVKAPSSDIKPFDMGNIRAVSIHLGPWAAGICLLLVLISLYPILRFGNLPDKMSGVILGALLVSPHTYWQDYSLLAIIAMMTENTAIRLLLLIPWPFLYPRTDALPMVCAALGYMIFLGARKTRVRIRAVRTTVAAGTSCA